MSLCGLLFSTFTVLEIKMDIFLKYLISSFRNNYYDNKPHYVLASVTYFYESNYFPQTKV